jgi:hypothetical protein
MIAIKCNTILCIDINGYTSMALCCVTYQRRLKFSGYLRRKCISITLGIDLLGNAATDDGKVTLLQVCALDS